MNTVERNMQKLNKIINMPSSFRLISFWTSINSITMIKSKKMLTNVVIFYIFDQFLDVELDEFENIDEKLD